MNIRRILSGAVLVCGASVLATQAHGQSDLEAKLRSFTPQLIIDEANQHTNKSGIPRPVQMPFVRADLDGNGTFDYVVAGYNVFDAGTVRVFRVVGGQVSLIGEPEGSPNLGSAQMRVDLMDVDNDGKPEIILRNFGATPDYALSVFKWTGHSLHLMNPDNSKFQNAFGNADLFDLDGNGVLSIVTPSSATELTDPNNPPPPGEVPAPYVVYKLKTGQYELASTSMTDPTSMLNATGDNQTVVGDARMKPGRFSLGEIRDAREKQESAEGEVTVRLGNLAAPADATPGPRRVEDIDLQSLILGRSMRPLRTRIVPSEDEPDDEGKLASTDHDSKEKKAAKLLGSFVKARFSRQAVLGFLPRAQLTKPLEPGDVLTLDIRGKMKNGAPVFASVVVKIVGDHDDDPAKHD